MDHSSDDMVSFEGAKIVEYGLSIHVTVDGKTKSYTKTYLTTCWLTMSNDAFYERFGFGWVPPLEMREQIKRKLECAACLGEPYHNRHSCGEGD